MTSRERSQHRKSHRPVLFAGAFAYTAAFVFFSAILFPRYNFLAAIVIPFAFVLAFICFGLPQQQKTTVLVLRRFGDRISAEVLRRALNRSLRRYYRFVTLDGHDIKPQGSFKTGEGTGSLGCAGCLGEIAGVGLVALTIGRHFKEEDWSSWFTSFFVWMPVYVPATLVLIAVGSSLVFRARVSVKEERDLDLVSRLVEQMRSPWFRSSQLGPRLLTIQSTELMWRSTVTFLTERIPVMIVDISVLSESLSWEIAHIREAENVRPVFVARKVVDDLGNPWAAMRHDQLAGLNVLTYEARGGNDQFCAELLAAVNRAADTVELDSPRTPSGPRLSFASRVLLACGGLYIAFILALAPAYEGMIKKALAASRERVQTVKEMRAEGIEAVEIRPEGEASPLAVVVDRPRLEDFTAACRKLTEASQARPREGERSLIIQIRGRPKLTFLASYSPDYKDVNVDLVEIHGGSVLYEETFEGEELHAWLSRALSPL